MSVNQIHLIGNLGQLDRENQRGGKAELSYTSGGKALVKASIATTFGKDDKKKTTWHNVTIWGNTAEFFHKNARTGALVYIRGRVENSKWEDKNGIKRTKSEIQCENLTMLGRKNDGVGEEIAQVVPKPINGPSMKLGPNGELVMEDGFDDMPY